MFLGLDLSTQQLKGVVIDESLNVHQEVAVDFDRDLSDYNTIKGVYRNGYEVFAPVCMWLDAIDLLFERLKASVDVSKIQAISGAGQQHASVFLLKGSKKALNSLDAKSSLKQQLESLIHPTSPNWQDASTTKECEELESCIGGAKALADLTGSKAHLRFTGPQIKRFRRLHPETYENTERIALVSNFLASVLLQTEAPLDISDVCGMNLWDIQNEKFDIRLLEEVAGNSKGPDLANKLGTVEINGAKHLGPIGKYFVKKYGFSPNCQIIPLTGDNPATILSLPLRPGKDVLLSLGTSTTALMATQNYVCSPEYHMFAHPVTQNHYMVMLCYKNGSLAREQVRNTINEKYNVSDNTSWDRFNESILNPNIKGAGEKKQLGLFYPQREILPAVGPGTWRFAIQGTELYQVDKDEESWDYPDEDASAIVESQNLDIRMRITPLLTGIPQPDRVYVVGGASRNEAIVFKISQVLGCDVYRLKHGGSNACAVGVSERKMLLINSY